MITFTPRLGTAKLLQLTKDCNKADQQQILEYIGKLESNEQQLMLISNSFISNFGHYIKIDPYDTVP